MVKRGRWCQWHIDACDARFARASTMLQLGMVHKKRREQEQQNKCDHKYHETRDDEGIHETNAISATKKQVLFFLFGIFVLCCKKRGRVLLSFWGLVVGVFWCGLQLCRGGVFSCEKVPPLCQCEEGKKRKYTPSTREKQPKGKKKKTVCV